VSRKYSNPPIVEALCEFRFVPIQPWDMTIPGLLYEKINSEFPEKQQQMAFDMGFQPKKGGVEQKVEMTQRMQFLRSDKSALVQVGPDLLTINHLKPYPTWEAFKPLIFNNLKMYREITKPKGFKRVGLRYINKIEFDKSPIELSDYFSYYPFIPKGLPQTREAFNVRIEIPYEDGRDRLLLTLASTIPEKPEVLSLLLDLDYIMAIPEHVPLDQAPDWIEKAHTRVENAFEACITDKCRALFGEVK
jgi:uncharacterized protein (TIGR04255 family)